jgi:hypothetical protein
MRSLQGSRTRLNGLPVPRTVPGSRSGNPTPAVPANSAQPRRRRASGRWPGADQPVAGKPSLIGCPSPRRLSSRAPPAPADIPAGAGEIHPAFQPRPGMPPGWLPLPPAPGAVAAGFRPQAVPAGPRGRSRADEQRPGTSPVQAGYIAGIGTAGGTSAPAQQACVPAPLAPISLARVKTAPRNPISVYEGSSASDPHAGARHPPRLAAGVVSRASTGRTGRRQTSVEHAAFTGAAPPRHGSNGSRRHPAWNGRQDRPGGARRTGDGS